MSTETCLNSSSGLESRMTLTYDRWKEALGNYKLALRSLTSTRAQNYDLLQKLDTAMYLILPETVASRVPCYINLNEYTLIIEWKLRRGVWRPQNLPMARKASDDDVKATSSRAFAYLERGALGHAISTLKSLMGSSTMVASAILSLRDSSIPFVSRELLRAVQGNSIDFHVRPVLNVIEKVRAKAKYLSSYGTTWTAVDVERAIFSEAHIPMGFEFKLWNRHEVVHNVGEPLEKEQGSTEIERETSKPTSAKRSTVPQSRPESMQDSEAGCQKTNNLKVRLRIRQAGRSNVEALEERRGEILRVGAAVTSTRMRRHRITVDDDDDYADDADDVYGSVVCIDSNSDESGMEGSTLQNRQG